MANMDRRNSTGNARGAKVKLPPLGGNGQPSESVAAVPATRGRSVAMGLPQIDGRAWPVWQHYLKSRPQPPWLGELLPDRICPLLWALDEPLLEQTDVKLIGRLHRLGSGKPISTPLSRRLITAWLQRAERGTPPVALAIEALAWAHVLPLLAANSQPELWWQLFCHVCQMVRIPRGKAKGADPLLDQLLGGELPMTLEYQFASLAPLRRLGVAARRVLCNGIIALTDGDGLLAGDHLHLTPALLACWTRCAAMARQMGSGLFTRGVQSQYAALVRESLRMTGPDGRWLSTECTARWTPGMLQAALALAGRKTLPRVARAVLPRMAVRALARPAGREPERLPSESNFSEWAAVGVLRARWSKNSPVLVVRYPRNRFELTLADAHGVLLSGAWDAEVRLDGQRLAPKSEWLQTCWYSDRHVDYLELLRRFDHRVQIQRHLMLSRDDGLLLLLDAVMVRKRGQLEYEGRLPLGRSIRMCSAAKTHEAFLADSRRRALLLPLALPEWRQAQSPGVLQEHEGAIVLRQEGTGRGLAAPLLVSLNRRSLSAPFTWRQLTVAENLRRVAPDTAAGYRVQLGGQQWLIYRSLGRPANRTVLGHNLISETLIARFGADGQVDPLVEIE